jgi:ubiquinol-cytochrome c reductase cytochrome b subunit
MRTLAWARQGAAVLALVSFLLLLTSGWALMAGYVPADSEAFSSVVFLRHQSPGGPQVRSLHYFLSSIVVIAGFIYLATTYLMGIHHKEKVAWWLALGLYFLVLGGSFTGYLLPMDQNAYWGSIVRLGIVETIPAVGTTLADLLRGGPVFNATTLPRFYALHAAALPTLMLILIGFLARPLFRPAQDSKKTVVWLGAGICILLLTLAATSIFSAPLEPRADPTDSNYVPRPEWYFFWLFQFGKYVEAVPWVQSLLLPLLGCGLLAALPFHSNQRLAGRLTLVLSWCLVWVTLTGLALYADKDLPEKQGFEEALRAGAASHYQDLCFECHGTEGRGDGPQSKIFDLDSKDFSAASFWNETAEEEMKRSIRDGKGKDMPAFSKQLNQEEIAALLEYIRNSFAPAKIS